MKIGIYTSTSISIYDSYNISEVMSAFPDAEFLILAVESKTNIINKVKQFLIQLRDGINYFKIDSKKIEKEFKRKKNIFYLKKYKYKLINAVNDQKSEQLFKEFKPDFIIQAGAGILTENIFKLSKIATLNVHHGFAPEVRGMNSTFWCLYFGLNDLIGVTCHIIDENLDTGNIIEQYKYNMNENDSFVDIQKKLCYEGAKLLINSIKRLFINPCPKFSYTTVNSYYFSSVDYRKYNYLRMNNFKPLEQNLIKTKEKTKKVII